MFQNVSYDIPCDDVPHGATVWVALAPVSLAAMAAQGSQSAERAMGSFSVGPLLSIAEP